MRARVRLAAPALTVMLAIAATGTLALAQPVTRHGTVRTDTVWSQALGARKALVVYLPPSYATERTRRYPVAYYLHGAWGDETNWSKLGKLAEAMDSLVTAGMPEMIVAMPDGDDSFYTTFNVLVDEPTCRRLLPKGGDAAHDCVAWPHYDDYVAFDVVHHVDAKYRTQADRAHRGIGGLSMGGYGAVALALQYPAEFAAAASHSGVLVPSEFAPGTLAVHLARPPGDSSAVQFRRSFGEQRFRNIFGADSVSWAARDPVHLFDAARARHATLPELFIDCGTDDRTFLPGNRAFRDSITARGVTVAYHEWPGAHDWKYWSAHVGESLAWLAARIAR